MWILLDVNNLCHRAFYALGSKMSYEDIPTGMLFGFLRDILTFQKRFNTNNIAFCFDDGAPLRKDIYYGYKLKRKQERMDMRPQQRRAFYKMREQIEDLKTKYLYDIGFRNIWYKPGFEADDVIAQMTDYLIDLEAVGKVTIVSGDKDLYQCLSGKTTIWSPVGHGKQNLGRKDVTLQSFHKQYRILPYQWAEVKAMAGCSSDNINGIPGVGEAKAIKYIRNELPGGKIRDRIESQQGKNRILENMELVDLPLQGTPTFEIKEDVVTKKKWQAFCQQFGLSSLETYTPLLRRRP